MLGSTYPLRPNYFAKLTSFNAILDAQCSEKVYNVYYYLGVYQGPKPGTQTMPRVHLGLDWIHLPQGPSSDNLGWRKKGTPGGFCRSTAGG